MTRVEFYVLPDDVPAGRLRAACRLAAKAWQQEMPIFIRCQDASQRGELDQLLWSLRPERFLPHALSEAAEPAPILLGLNDAPPPRVAQGLLINLAQDLSAHADHFSRVIEIVNQEPAQLANSRDNFRLYRQRGYAPQRVEL